MKKVVYTVLTGHKEFLNDPFQELRNPLQSRMRKFVLRIIHTWNLKPGRLGC